MIARTTTRRPHPGDVPIRVLYVAPGDLSIDRKNYNQVQRLLHAPPDVRLEVLVERDTEVLAGLPSNVIVRRARFGGRIGLYAAEARQLLRPRRFVAVATTNSFESIPARVLRPIGRYRWVADIWDTPHKALVTLHPLARGTAGRIRRAAARLKVGLFERMLGSADLVIVSACAEGMSRYRLRPERVRVFTNAIDLSEFPTADGPREPSSICFVSSLFLADRGLGVLIAAGEIAAQRGVDTKIRIAGVVPPEVQHATERRQGFARLELLGSISLSSAHDLMRRSEIGVLPFLRNEDLAHTQPVKLFEYMASGCVVVASDLPGFRQIVRPEIDAILVPPGDAEALASALRRVMADEDLRERLRASARERVEVFDARTKVHAIFSQIAGVA